MTLNDLLTSLSAQPESYLAAIVGEYELDSEGHKAGVKTRPACDVLGQPVGDNGTRAGVGVAQFVILPALFTDWSLLDEVRAALVPGKPSQKGKAKSGE